MRKIEKVAAIWIAGFVLCACSNPIEQSAAQPMPEQLVEETQEITSEVAAPNQAETPSEESIVSDPVSSEAEPATQEPQLTAKVPEGLKKLLTESFQAGTAAETLNAIMSDVVVEKEEYELYRDRGIDADLSHLEEYGGVLLRVDADNDGIEDLFLWIDDGGSMGNSTFLLSRGNEEGDYEITECQETLSQEIAFVKFEGQNYLVETNYEYNRKAVNGFIVTCYEHGQISDRVCLEAVVSAWKADIISCSSEYRTLAGQYAELGKDGFHDNNMYDYRVDAGSGERVEENEDTVYYADINNDGVEEWYDKHIHYPSNISTWVWLVNDLYFAEEPYKQEYLTGYYNLQYEGTPLTFWVEQTTDETGQRKQVVCLLTYEGLSTNRIYGYLIEGEAVTELFEIEYEGQLEFQYITELEEMALKG